MYNKNNNTYIGVFKKGQKFISRITINNEVLESSHDSRQEAYNAYLNAKKNGIIK